MAGTQGVVTTAQQPFGTVLRRAIYIHVSDIMNAYNIDHMKLEEELARVLEESKSQSETKGIPKELDTSLSSKRLQVPREGFNTCV